MTKLSKDSRKRWTDRKKYKKSRQVTWNYSDTSKPARKTIKVSDEPAVSHSVSTSGRRRSARLTRPSAPHNTNIIIMEAHNTPNRSLDKDILGDEEKNEAVDYYGSFLPELETTDYEVEFSD